MSTTKRGATTAANTRGGSTGSPPEADLRRRGGSTGNTKGKRKPPPSAAPTPPPEARGRRKKRKGAAAFVPTKGGDGGRAVKIKRGPNWNANGLLVLTGASIRCKADRAAFELLLIETTDPCDRGHRRKKMISGAASPAMAESWVICALGEVDLPGGEPVSRARRYHPSQVVGRPGKQVGFDSMFDDAARSAARLEAAGIEMGWHTTRVGECSRMEQALRHRYEGVDWHAVRDALEQKTTQRAITREDIGD